jgi:hypothetical protein
MKPRRILITRITAVLLIALLVPSPGTAYASVSSSSQDQTRSASGAGEGSNALESAASKASETGRRVAMSLIGLAFALAGVALAFRRDFKEAIGVFAVGFVAVLLVTPAGIGLMHDTVNSLFASQ